MSDRVLIMNAGRIAQYSTPEEIVHAPVSQFIKDFILRQLIIKRNNIYALFGDVSSKGTAAFSKEENASAFSGISSGLGVMAPVFEGRGVEAGRA